jgi:hypothetical protein
VSRFVPNLYPGDQHPEKLQVRAPGDATSGESRSSALQVSATSGDHRQTPSDHQKQVGAHPAGSGGIGPRVVPDLYRDLGRRYRFLNPPVVVVAVASWALVALAVAALVGWLG